MENLFISGSIAIKHLPLKLYKVLDSAIANNYQILIGDAKGIDTLVQDYLAHKKYFNVNIYSISVVPRYRASIKFWLTTVTVPPYLFGREAQQEKDKAMTNDSTKSFVVWNGESKGSYANIIRAINQSKPVTVYLEPENTFIANPSKELIDSKFNLYSNLKK